MLRAPRSRAARQKIERHSLGRSAGSAGERTTASFVGSTVKNSSGRIRSLWTPVGASSRPSPSAGPEMPPPVPDTQPFA